MGAKPEEEGKSAYARSNRRRTASIAGIVLCLSALFVYAAHGSDTVAADTVPTLSGYTTVNVPGVTPTNPVLSGSTVFQLELISSQATLTTGGVYVMSTHGAIPTVRAFLTSSRSRW